MADVGNGRRPITGERPLSDVRRIIFLPHAVRDAVIAHARQEAPRECCGLLVGSPGSMTGKRPAVRLLRLTNVAPEPDRYVIDADDVFRVTRDSEDDGQDIVAIYHSHPTGPARPSATDIELAFWPDAVSLICGLEGAGAPLIRAFTILDGQVIEHTIVIT